MDADDNRILIADMFTVGCRLLPGGAARSHTGVQVLTGSQVQRDHRPVDYFWVNESAAADGTQA